MNKFQDMVLIDQQEIDITKESLSSFFRTKSEDLQEVIGTDFKKLYPQKEIAKRLNISTDQLRNKIYRKKNKPLTRDWLIAICAAYGLDDADTSEALSICDMPTLDDASNRERFIVNFLRDNKYNPVSIEKFNMSLLTAGLDPLDVSFKKKVEQLDLDKKFEKNYREIRPRVVRTYEDQGDTYDSLKTLYLPNMRCVAAAFVENVKGEKYVIEAYSDGDYRIEKEGDIFPKSFTQLSSDHEFYCIFVELSGLVKKRKYELDNVIKDSKNYKGRFSANIKEDSIHVFYEEYNYSMPERNEYYLMEYIKGKYSLTISHESLFMEEYLSEEKYTKHYGKKTKIQRISFYSLEDIDEFYKNRNLYFYPDLIASRKNVYNRLKRIVEEKLNLIRLGEIRIQNFDYIWRNPGEVLTYYNVEKEFKCNRDNEYGEIYYEIDEAFFKCENGEEILISFEDIRKAFELGIESIQEICRIKQKYGSINSLLEK